MGVSGQSKPRGYSPLLLVFLLFEIVMFSFSPNSLLLGGFQFFLKMCLPFVSLLVSAHFRWPSSNSIHSPNSLLLGGFSILS